MQPGLCPVPQREDPAPQQPAVAGAQPAAGGTISLPEQAGKPALCSAAAGEPLKVLVTHIASLAHFGTLHTVISGNPNLSGACNAADNGPFAEGSLAMRLFINMGSTRRAAALLTSLCCPITKVLGFPMAVP